MADNKKYSKILKATVNAHNIASLKNRPNQPTEYGGNQMSAEQLKQRFDSLSNIIIDQLNSIITDIYNGGFAQELKLGDTDNSQTLKGLVESITEATGLANKLIVEGSGETGKTLINKLTEIDLKLSNLLGNTGASYVKGKYGTDTVAVQDVINKVDNGDLGKDIKVKSLKDPKSNASTEETDKKLRDALVEIIDATRTLKGTLLDHASYMGRSNTKNIPTQLAEKVDKGTYATDKTNLWNKIGNNPINTTLNKNNITDTVNLLASHVDSLQLGFVPRVLRNGMDMLRAVDPSNLANSDNYQDLVALAEEGYVCDIPVGQSMTLEARLTAYIVQHMGRQPNNTDSIAVVDCETPDKGKVYVYYYWTKGTSDETPSIPDGWYLAQTSMSPENVTNIGAYTKTIAKEPTGVLKNSQNSPFGITNGDWIQSTTRIPEIDPILEYLGVESLWFMLIAPTTEFQDQINNYAPDKHINLIQHVHGMGIDSAITVQLKKRTKFLTEEAQIPLNHALYEENGQVHVLTNGLVVIYSDDPFEGEITIKTGKAYYVSGATEMANVPMEQVTGLNAKLDTKADITKIENGEIIAGEAGKVTKALKISNGSNTTSYDGATEITINKASLGLGNVNNTADSAKCVKQAKDYDTSSGGIKNALAEKANTTDMNTALAGKADTGHNHNNDYAPKTHTHPYAPASHNHDETYYTETEIDSKLATVNSAIAGKADAGNYATLDSDNIVIQTAANAKNYASGGSLAELALKVNWLIAQQQVNLATLIEHSFNDSGEVINSRTRLYRTGQQVEIQYTFEPMVVPGHPPKEYDFLGFYKGSTKLTNGSDGYTISHTDNTYTLTFNMGDGKSGTYQGKKQFIGGGDVA